MTNWIQIFESFAAAVDKNKEQACSLRVYTIMSAKEELRKLRLLELGGFGLDLDCKVSRYQRAGYATASGELVTTSDLNGMYDLWPSRNHQAQMVVNNTDNAYWLDMALFMNGTVKPAGVNEEKIITEGFLHHFGPYWSPTGGEEAGINLRDIRILVINDTAGDVEKASGMEVIENMYLRLRPLFREDFCVIRLK